MIKNLLPFSLLVLLALSGCGKSVTDQVRDGDIIFHTSRSPQSGAIQKATHSKYSHMGIIFLRDGNPFVFEANKTVQYTPLEKWIARGEGVITSYSIHYTKLYETLDALDELGVGHARSAVH